MNTPTTAVTKSNMLSGRDFNAFFLGRIEISYHPHTSERLEISFGPHTLFVADQIIDVNQGDRSEPLELPFLDALPRRDFFARGK